MTFNPPIVIYGLGTHPPDIDKKCASATPIIGRAQLCISFPALTVRDRNELQLMLAMVSRVRLLVRNKAKSIGCKQIVNIIDVQYYGHDDLIGFTPDGGDIAGK